MRNEIIISFRPEYLKPILLGIKEYEYRSRFRKEATIAYLYLSRPVQAIVGIMELGVPIVLDEIIAEFDKESEQYKNIMFIRINGNNLAIPIRAFKLYKEPIYLLEINQMDAKFRPPMSYVYADNYTELHELLRTRDIEHVIPINECDSINDNLGMTVSQMEDSNIYKKEYKLKKDAYSKILEIIE